MKYLVITRNTGEEVAWIKSNDEECIRDTMLGITESDFEVVESLFNWMDFCIHSKSNNYFGFREGVIKLAEV